jgi:hypothetical protein
MKMRGYVFCTLFVFACGGDGNERVQEHKQVESELPELLGGTDSLFVRTKKKGKMLLVGQKIKTTYASFHTKRQANFGFLGSIMRRLNENKSQLLGPVHLIMLEEPGEDSLEYFAGLPVSSSKGFIENEIYELAEGQYYSTKTGKTAGTALSSHQALQLFLKENKHAYQAPFIEVWRQQMGKDMSRRENIQLLYSIK